jgi:hypothetical protein
VRLKTFAWLALCKPAVPSETLIKRIMGALPM